MTVTREEETKIMTQKKLLVIRVAMKIDYSMCGSCVPNASGPDGVNFMFC
jgi:hypothetical protein